MSVAESRAREGEGEAGTFYTLHFEPPFKHARHYSGWTSRDVSERLREHLAGKGSPLVKAAADAGVAVVIARIVPGVDRHFERAQKEGKNVPRTCPICQGVKTPLECVHELH